MFDEGTKRYRRDISKRDEVDDELDKMLASPQVVHSSLQSTEARVVDGLQGLFYPGQHKDSEEECSPSFRVTKKRGKKALGELGRLLGHQACREPDIDQEFMDDIERIRQIETRINILLHRADENV